MIEKETLTKILQSYLPFCKEGSEWGGCINLITGEIIGPFKGDGEHFYVKKEVVTRKQGWVIWHSHSVDNWWDVQRKKILERIFNWKPTTGNSPSAGDLIAAHFFGGPCYVLTSLGIWEVIPQIVFPKNDVDQRVRLASTKAITQAKKLGLRPNNRNDQRWQELARSAIQEVLPTKVSIIHSTP